MSSKQRVKLDQSQNKSNQEITKGRKRKARNQEIQQPSTSNEKNDKNNEMIECKRRKRDPKLTAHSKTDLKKASEQEDDTASGCDKSRGSKTVPKHVSPKETEMSSKFMKRLLERRSLQHFIRLERPENDVYRALYDAYEENRDEKKAAQMSKYMGDQFDFFGIPAGLRRRLDKKIWPMVKSLNSSELRTLACETGYAKEREFHYFTTELFEKELMRMYKDDNFPPQRYAEETLNFVGQFIGGNSWWDTVDPLATNVVGPLVQKYPDYLLPILDKWNLDQGIWLCRVSLLYQLKYGKDTDEDRLFRYCLKVSHREEFFIQKAIGWALRQHFRTNPEAVRDLVAKNKRKLSNLSIREALKHDK